MMIIPQLCSAAAFLLLGSLESTAQELKKECPPGKFGPRCQYACHCKGTNSCSTRTGNCASRDCARGYVGDGCQYVNLAFNGKTSSERLVDSDVITCESEQVDKPQWIDLRKTFWLRRFKISTNGTKKDGQVYIQITDSSAADPEWMASSNIGVTWFQDGDVDIFLKYPVRGRFVWLRGQHLHLCEVYVFGGRNVALLRQTSQSTTLSTFTSSLAVDGLTSQDFEDKTCSHTQRSPGEMRFQELKDSLLWWRVNLTATHVITRVVIYNRLGNLDKLSWFRLKAGPVQNVSRLRTVYQSPEADPPPVVDIVPDTPLSLGLLQVEVSGRGRVLTLCEMQLFGDCPDMTYGPSCNYTCDCADPEEVCDSFSGACLSGQAGNVKPPISFEDGDSDDTDDDNNNTEYTLPSVVAVVAVIAFIATGLAVAVWRRRRKQRAEKYDGSNSDGREAFPRPSDEEVYEEVESPHSPESSSVAPHTSTTNGKTSNSNASKDLSNFRKKLQMFEFAASISGKTNKVEFLHPNSDTSDVYEDANSSGGACAHGEGSGSGDVYEALGDRDYETPYTIFKPVPAKKTK